MGRFRGRCATVRLLVTCALIGSIFLLVAPSTVDADAGGATIEGILTTIDGDPMPGSGGAAREFTFITDAAGNQTSLIVGESVARVAGGLMALDRKRGSVVAAPAPGAVRPGGTVPARTVSTIRPVDAPSRVAPLTGAKPFINILCAFADSPAVQPQPAAYFTNTLFSATRPGIDAFWRENSLGNITLAGTQTVGWFTLTSGRATYLQGGNLDLHRAAVDCTTAAAASVNFNLFAGINLMFNQPLDCCAYGGADVLTLSGVTKYWPVTWIPPWGYYPDPSKPTTSGQTVLAHETGHAFGLIHSAGPTGLALTNGWDAMGDASWHCENAHDATVGCVGRHSIAFDKDVLGWIPAANRLTYAGGTQTVTLSALSEGPVGGTYLEIVLPHTDDARHFTTVELRSQIGFDARNPYAAVLIHDVDTTRANPAWAQGSDGYDGANFAAGSFYDVPVSGRVRVTVQSVAGSRAVVRLGPAPPATPTSLHVAGATTSTVSFAWTAPDATSGIVVSNGATVTDLGVAAASFTQAGIAPGGYACLSVAAYSAAGASPWSAWVCGLTVPGTPSNVHKTGATGSSVSSAWTPPDGASAIAVSNGSVATALAPGTSTYTQTGVPPGYWTCVSVAAYNASGASPWTGWVCGFAIPAPPTGVHVTGHTPMSVSFAWTPQDPFAGIAVSNGTAVSLVGVAGTTYKQAGMAAGDWVCVSTAAYNVSGASGWTPWVCGQAG